MSNYLNSCNNPLANVATGKIYSARQISTKRHEGTLTALLSAWFQRWQQRRALENLPPYLLKDIGISEFAAQREAAKPFWAE